MGDGEDLGRKYQIMRAQILDDEISEQREKRANVKRVSMQCLDFDWIFNFTTD